MTGFGQGRPEGPPRRATAQFARSRLALDRARGHNVECGLVLRSR
jgi:hypothetical protein